MTPEQEALAALSLPEDADRGRVAKVTWVDSGQSLHAFVREQAMPVIESVGLWMGESDEIAMLAGSYDERNQSWAECQLIWKPAIQSKEWLS